MYGCTLTTNLRHGGIKKPCIKQEALAHHRKGLHTSDNCASLTLFIIIFTVCLHQDSSLAGSSGKTQTVSNKIRAPSIFHVTGNKKLYTEN